MKSQHILVLNLLHNFPGSRTANSLILVLHLVIEPMSVQKPILNPNRLWK